MRALFWASMGVWSYMIGSAYLPLIEGRLFPVVVGVQITQTEAAGPISTRIWGEFEKVRDCTFLGIEFYLGDIDRSARAQLMLEEGSKVRGNGFEDWGPWVVQLTESQLAENSYAIVRHRCHPFWETVTRFY